jgi:hypothetical protein
MSHTLSIGTTAARGMYNLVEQPVDLGVID